MNAFTDGAVTTRSGRLFHELTTLMEKNFWRWQVELLFFKSYDHVFFLAQPPLPLVGTSESARRRCANGPVEKYM